VQIQQVSKLVGEKDDCPQIPSLEVKQQQSQALLKLNPKNLQINIPVSPRDQNPGKEEIVEKSSEAIQKKSIHQSIHSGSISTTNA